MKQNKLFKLWLLAVVMLAGSMSAWADNSSLDCPLGTISGTTMTFTDAINFTIVHAKGTDANFAAYSPWRVYTNNTVTFTGNANVGTITSVVITAGSNTYAAAAVNGTLTVLTGTGSASGSADGSTATITMTGEVKEFRLKPSAQTRWSNIVINYTTSASCVSADLAFANSTVTKSVTDAPFTNAATSLNATADITYSSSDAAVATVDATTGEVTIVAAGTATITASQDAGTHNEVDYCAGTATYTLNVTGPSISADPTSVNLSAETGGSTVTRDFTVTGANLTADINAVISGTGAGQFSLSSATLPQAGGTLTVTYTPAAAAATHAATLTLSSAGATDVVVTLTGETTELPIGGTSNETFETQTALTASYADGSFSSETSGVTVNYVHSRNEGLGTSDNYSINGKGIMLRRSDEPSSVEFVIPSGVGTFSFDYRKAFTAGENNRILALLVDGIEVATTGTFGLAGADATVHNLTHPVNKANTVSVKITYPAGTATGNKQITIDNVNWTAYDPTAVTTAAPTFTPPAGTYTSVQSVELASTTTDAKIYYTTDGTEPTSASTLYTAAIPVNATTTIKAIAYDAEDANPSAVVSATYTFPPTETDYFRSAKSGNWEDTATWEQLIGGVWTSNSAPANNTTNNVYIRHAISINSSLITPANVIVENNGTLTITASSTINTSLLVKTGGTLQINAALAIGSSGTFTVQSGGLVNINYAAASGVASLWAGTENFMSGSTVNIQNWNYGVGNGDNRLIQNPSIITANADGYYFGNLIISGAPSAIFVMSEGSQTINLCQNDFTTSVTGNNVAFTNSASNVTIGGNVIVTAGQLSFAATTTGYPIATIFGNIQPIGGTINLNQNSAGTNSSTINLSGNLIIPTGVTLTSSDPDSKIVFAGTAEQSLSITGTLANNVAFDVNNAATVKINQNLTLAATNPLTIKAGGKLTLINGKSLTTTPALTIQSDGTNGTGTYVDENTGTGLPAITGIVNQAVTAQRTYYMGLPVSVSPEITGITGISKFNIDTDTWSDIATQNTTFNTKGIGYLVQVADGSTTNISFKGTLNSGSIEAPFSTAKRRFNYYGNPYPSFLETNKVITAAGSNIDPSIWFYSKGSGSYAFTTYNSITEETLPSTADGGVIPPMQGFWLRAKAGASAVPFTFTNAMRLHKPTGSNAIFKAPKAAASSKLNLTISNGTVADETLVLFNEAAQTGFDVYDSEKMMNSAPSLNIFTVVGDQKLAMNGMPAVMYDTEIPLGVNVPAGTYTISAIRFANFAEGEKVQLIDKATNTLTDISATDYTFAVSEALNNTTRFVLVFPSKVGTSVNSTEMNISNVYVSDGRIVVNVTKPVQGNLIEVYNSVGQRIASQAITASSNRIEKQLNSGVYIVKVNAESTKVIIK